MKTNLSLALAAVLIGESANAALSTNLIAYFTFEQAGEAGLKNQIGAGATHNGTYGSATTYGIVPAIAGSGAGYAGSATYEGAEATNTTDRATLLVGNALNVAKSDASATAGSGWFNVPSLDATTLGSNFTISAWFFLAPDADNTGTDAAILRDYVFEPANLDNWDVSYGSTDANGNTFTSWLGTTARTNVDSTLATGQWHHVLHSFAQNGSNITLSIYVNGVKVGGTLSVPATNMDFTSINFGAARTGFRVFDGMLDEVAVWNRSLTANEAIELYQRGQASLSLDADLATAGKAFVNVEASNPMMGYTLGSGLYNLNEEVVIEAYPAIGHVFTAWDAPHQSQPDFFSHTVTGSVTITANFAQDTEDPDMDGLSNYQELVIHQTYPNNADTDNDLLNDGDEVNLSLTDPRVSQLDSVKWIQANLAGGTSPGDIVLNRDPVNNSLTFRLTAKESTLLQAWSTLSSASSSVTGEISGSDLLFQFPGTGDRERFFRVEGSAVP